MSKIISVVIPVYNVEKYLRECLDSVVNQTYKNLQIILVDDGSTDNSGEICDEYAEKDSRITVVHQKNAGAAVAKNAGLNAITGDYFTFVDSDDYIEKSTFEIALKALEENNADVVEFGFFYTYKNREENQWKREVNFYNKKDYIKKYTYDWTSSLLWNKLYKSSLTKNVRFANGRRCVDDEFYTYKVMMNADKVVSIKESFYHYRKRLSSAVNNADNAKQITIDEMDFLLERYKFVYNRIPSLRPVFLDNLLSMSYVLLRNHYIDKSNVSKLRSFFRQVFWKHLKYKKLSADMLRLLFISFLPYNKFISYNEFSRNTQDVRDHFK